MFRCLQAQPALPVLPSGRFERTAGRDLKAMGMDEFQVRPPADWTCVCPGKPKDAQHLLIMQECQSAGHWTCGFDAVLRVYPRLSAALGLLRHAVLRHSHSLVHRFIPGFRICMLVVACLPHTVTMLNATPGPACVLGAHQW